MHDTGQPMHAFDVSKLSGPAIIVRRARDGETIVTLDGVPRTLDASMTVIADAERAQAVAGVMGGATSEVSDGTTDIFLEVANFDPASVRHTRRVLGLSTDASYRFERHVDVDAAPAILERAARMIIEVAGGRIEGAPVDILPVAVAPRSIGLRLARASTLLGVAMTRAEAVTLLQPVGFTCATGSDDTIDVGVPSWRSDVTAEVNLVEELARLRGYDSFPDELRPFRAGTSPDAPLWSLMKRVRARLIASGLLEVRPMPFVAGAEDGFARITNPLAENESYLRRDLLDTLARRAEYNLARMHGNLRLFEIGAAFEPTSDVLPREEMRAAALIMGLRRPPHFTEPNPPAFDEWDAKALADSMLESLGIAGSELIGGEGETLWEMRAGGERVGRVVRVALDAPVWASPAFGVEMRIESTESEFVAPKGAHAPAGAEVHSSRAGRAFRALPSMPASDIDVALLVPNDMPAARVESVIRASSGAMLESLDVVSEYRGEGVPEGFRSIAWRLTFRDPARTLQSKEIAGRREKLLRTLEGELGVRQRTA
ncbi:MAG: phenylalanine--tRNA ligase subunit beta, partial [Gemmatimonadota bacterium]|nr:phenylalanine--tRNA ligase subunit beta [Gemmatimonadota bacterium]